MKSKLLTILLLTSVISSVGIVTATSTNIAKNAKKVSDISITSAPQIPTSVARQDMVDEPGFVNGAKHPELIPDRVAYSLIFRLVGGAPDAAAKERIRHYIRQAVGDCGPCNGERLSMDEGKNKDQDSTAFIAAADEFQRRVSILDQQVISLKTRNWPPSAETMAQLAELQRQKEAIVAEIVASLPKRLSASGMNRLRLHINQRVKKNMKLKIKDEQSSAPSVVMLHNSDFAR